MQRITIFLLFVAGVFGLFSTAGAAIVLDEFDVTNSLAGQNIPSINIAPGLTSSPVVPIGLSDPATFPGLYWNSNWTSASSAAFNSQRLFFNLIADASTTVTFDHLTFFANSGSPPAAASYELRVFGSGGSTLFSPQLVTHGTFSASNFAAPISIDVSSLAALHNDAYQFSISFYNNAGFRIGLSGNL